MIDQEKLWRAEEVAEYLQVSTRQVAERYAMMPNFPQPIRLPSPKGKGVYRWKKQDIIDWVDSLRHAA